LKSSKVKAWAGILVGLGCAAHVAQAQEVYVGAGLFGVQVGYAFAVTPNVNLRGDFLTMGSREKSFNESGTAYQGKINWSRKALLADWFPSGSSFRVTAGATFNDVGFDLYANGAGQKVDINGRQLSLSANDSLNIQVKMPSTTPYIGIGFGHKPGSKGWGFHSDFGASLGKFKVTETRTGGLVNGGSLGVTQSDVDKELADVREGVAKLKFLPQLTLGVSYHF
jgi:hypothetical protein